MLSSPTPFPYVGSYALLEDDGEDQLVRIQMRREGEVVVSFPLRDGAAGNKRINPLRLKDATPLTGAEAQELRELDRALAGRSPRTQKQKRQQARRDALRHRSIYAPIMERMLRDARRLADSRRAA